MDPLESFFIFDTVFQVKVVTDACTILGIIIKMQQAGWRLFFWFFFLFSANAFSVASCSCTVILE